MKKIQKIESKHAKMKYYNSGDLQQDKTLNDVWDSICSESYKIKTVGGKDVIYIHNDNFFGCLFLDALSRSAKFMEKWYDNYPDSDIKAKLIEKKQGTMTTFNQLSKTNKCFYRVARTNDFGNGPENRSNLKFKKNSLLIDNQGAGYFFTDLYNLVEYIKAGYGNKVLEIICDPCHKYFNKVQREPVYYYGGCDYHARRILVGRVYDIYQVDIYKVILEKYPDCIYLINNFLLPIFRTSQEEGIDIPALRYLEEIYQKTVERK